ncbi:MAG: GNAT family N-acetyltransferase [Nitriliruptorales bacterium]|nr:GNAT family N-acetyltransferase [Nitriliruptorales bacterium]
MELVVRPPDPADAAGLARIWIDAGRLHRELDPRLFQVPDEERLVDAFSSSLATQPTDPEHRLSLVAVAGDEVVGAVLAVLEEPEESADTDLLRERGWLRVKVWVLLVRADRRRQGVGARLMEEVEAWARRRGAALVYLNTYIDNPTSVPFFEQTMGYERRAVRFDKLLSDAE